MAEDLTRIQRFVDALVRRERGLLLARIVARLALLLAVLAALGAGAAVLRWDRSAAMLLWVLVGGIGTWIAVALPLLREWAVTGDVLRQAERVEALAPELRGRLLTAVERTDGPHGGESEALLGLVARRAAGVVTSLSVAAVHPARRVVRLAVATGVVWLMFLPLLLLAGPDSVVRWWMAGVSAQAAVAGLSVQLPEELARVGDLVLHYRYPDYTGLEPKTVPNSTGDVQGPPGTVVEVTARSADRVEAAGLVAYEERLDATLDDEGRTIQGRFTIQAVAGGTYQLVLYQGGEAVESRAFTIEAQEDLPPDVMIDVGTQEEVIEVALDEYFELGWRARDDFGVRRVGLQVDGRDVGSVLARPSARKAEVSGVERLSPRDLQLAPGDRAMLTVVAWDNDTVSGSKKGQSRAVEIVVLGARGLERREAERQAELLKLMIPVLARYLTEAWPPGDTSGEMAVWGETVARRYEPLVDAVERVWSGSRRQSLDRDMAERVVRAGTDLVRYTQVSFAPDEELEASEEAVQVTAGMRDTAIETLEDAILALHHLQKNRALAEVARQADELATAAELIEEMLQNPDADAQELLARLDQLERMMERMMQAAQQLDQGGLRELLGARENELQNLMDQIREALAQGDLERARELMERLSQQLQEMADAIRNNLEQRQGEGDELGSKLQEVLDELEELETEQRDLQAQVQEIREQDRQGADQAAKLWEKLQELAAAHRASADGYLSGLETHERAFYEKERARRGIEEAEELAGAVEARDVRGTRGAVLQGKSAWAAVRRGLDMELDRRSELPGPGQAEVTTLLRQLLQIERLLDQLEQASSQSSPQTRQQAEQLQQQQKDLDNRLKQARQQAEQVAQQLPVRPDNMSEALEQAQDRTEQAGEDLGQGQLLEAEGSQGVAAQRIREAREALQRSKQQMQQQMQQLQDGEGEGSGRQQEGEQGEGNQDGDNGQQHDFEELEIPGREEFRTPEEYRRALLEGMEGEVPEEYRAMKKRYYEELVHQ